MIGYAVSRSFTLSVRGQRKTLKAAPSLEEPTADTVYIAAQWEANLLRKALAATWPQENIGRLLRAMPQTMLTQMAGFPAILGAGAYADPAREALPHCLASQLRAIKAVEPLRQHFRLLLINGFGSNLGDMMIGLTAFRQVLKVLRGELPAVSVDIMLGWHKDDRLERLLRGVDGIDNVVTQGLSLAEMTRYQGIFDTSKLLWLPRYGQMPLVDWYLWWMGADHGQVAAADKRNHVAIPETAARVVEHALAAVDGPRVLVNPKASVALRGMPEAIARKCVERLLAAWPEARVLLTCPLDFEHPRLHVLADATPTVDHLAALLCRVDGLIGVDTYTHHLADATSTPSVALMASMPPEIYPYYPLGEALLLPDAQKLPAWRKAKVAEKDWPAMLAVYDKAWQAVDFEAVLATLRRLIAQKQADRDAYPARLYPEPTPKAGSTEKIEIEGQALDVPIRQRRDPLAQSLHQTIIGLAKQMLARGDVVVQLGTGVGESAVSLARQVGAQGRLVAFEPRLGLHRLLCANLQQAGIRHAETHWVMPEGEGYAMREIAGLSIDDEYMPLSMGNIAQPEAVVCWPLDDRELNACRLLVVCSPLPLLSVLQGAKNTIKCYQPVIVAGVLHLRDAPRLTEYLREFGYQARILELGDRARPQYGIVLAEPPGGTVHINAAG